MNVLNHWYNENKYPLYLWVCELDATCICGYVNQLQLALWVCDLGTTCICGYVNQVQLA